jgi:hypothetical protein
MKGRGNHPWPFFWKARKGPGALEIFRVRDKVLIINKAKIEKTRIVRLEPGGSRDSSLPGEKTEERERTGGRRRTGRKSLTSASDAGIEGGPRSLLTRFRRTHCLVRSSPAGLSHGHWNSLTSKECLFYFGLLYK